MNWRKVKNAYTAEAKRRTFTIRPEQGLYTCSVEGIPFCKRPTLTKAQEECETMVKLWGDSPPVIAQGNEYIATYRTKKTRRCRKGVTLLVEYQNATIYAETLRQAKATGASQAPEGFTLYEVRTAPAEKNRGHVYYGVIQSIYPSGGYDVGIVQWEAEYIPEDTYYTRTTGEIITKWFKSELDAENYRSLLLS